MKILLIWRIENIIFLFRLIHVLSYMFFVNCDQGFNEKKNDDIGPAVYQQMSTSPA